MPSTGNKDNITRFLSALKPGGLKVNHVKRINTQRNNILQFDNLIYDFYLLKTWELSFIHLFKNVVNAIFHVPEKKNHLTIKAKQE